MSEYRFVLDGQGDTPALVTAHAPRSQGWNGFAVPVASGAELRAYVAAAVANDRHHVWTGEVLEEEEGIGRIPAEMPSFPLLISLVARKPA